jgi:uncharacterized protein YgiM (DUF1202 family)
MHFLSDLLDLLRRRPEPLEPHDSHDGEPRWALWAFAAAAVIGIGGLVTLLVEGRPAASSMAPVAAMRSAPDSSLPARFAAAPAVVEPAVTTALPPLPPLATPTPQTAEPPAPTERRVVTTAPSGANMRATPSLSSAVVWKAPKGTLLRVTGEEGNWLRVAMPSGARAGWIHRSVVAD